ncbi:unnamed protein product [Spirodela intermedia]|uniref:C3H1-type domain-containing protein n=1 Tax=Spirodela intermedia TaxID=51605 RepID=A0A7I8IH67_SPIIN|nr:unnamed protein product [Spirodela intermedia]CAA6657225.1 unnamed protein product [Spirodela intermedia]
MSRTEHRGEEAITIAVAASDDGEAIWAAEDEYQSKRARGSQGDPTAGGRSSRSGGKIFFKTKLCGKFRAGTCPYVTTCNFAHGMEELRRPPANWHDLVAGEEHQIPTLSSSANNAGDGERPYKGRRCKKFYTGEGCPYGDSCTFLHDEESKARRASPSPSAAAAVAAGSPPGRLRSRPTGRPGSATSGRPPATAPSAAKLHKYGGGLVEAERRETSTAAAAAPPAAGVSSSKAPAEPPLPPSAASGGTVAAADVYHVGRRSAASGTVEGPGKISRIYGDWIDDNE